MSIYKGTNLIAGGSGGSSSDNAYTKENLIAGDNVTFSVVPPAGGIDEHTVGCWHFDTDDLTKNEVKNSIIDVASSYAIRDTDFIKFGEGSLSSASSISACPNIELYPQDYAVFPEFTIDWWLYNTSNSESGVTISDYSSGSSDTYGVRLTNYDDWTESIVLYKNTTNLEIKQKVVSKNVWHHFALVWKDGYLYVFVDGVKEIEYNRGISTLSFLSLSAPNSTRIDELRISDIARYTEDFTPPTEPYKVATGENKTAINAIIPTASATTPGLVEIASEEEVDAGTATDKCVTVSQLHDSIQPLVRVLNDKANTEDTNNGLTKLADSKQDKLTAGEGVLLTDNAETGTTEIAMYIPTYATQAELPNASEHSGTLAYCVGLGTLVFSVGTDWKEVVLSDLPTA